MIASFIIKISSLSKEELKKLEQYCHKSETRAGVVTEILLYSDEDLEVRSPCKNIQVFIHKDIAIAHRLAVAAASGEWLSFTTIRYLIRDKKQLLPKTAYNAPAKHVLLSNSSKVFFMVISKIYYADVINSIAQLKDILDNAEQKQYIHHIKPTVNDFLYEDVQDQFKNISLSPMNLTWKKDIPVFIICYNRLRPLKELLGWLSDEGLTNIILIDNSSTYPPLLKFYQKTKHTVVRLSYINAGHTVFWSQGINNLLAYNRPFILTDPDIIPDKNSHGATRHFMNLLNKYGNIVKVGFGLEINDLPDHYALKQNVLHWEKQFWEKPVEDGVFSADIDTTFALYRPNTEYVLGPALRTGGKYVARHEPWYIDSTNPGEEILHYQKTANSSSSWGIKQNDRPEYHIQVDT